MQNFIAGMVLVAQEPIKMGDYVSGGGAEGEVLGIGITHSTIMTPQRQWVIVCERLYRIAASHFQSGAQFIVDHKPHHKLQQITGDARRSQFSHSPHGRLAPLSCTLFRSMSSICCFHSLTINVCFSHRCAPMMIEYCLCLNLSFV